MATDTSRRDLLKLAVLLPLMPALPLQSNESQPLAPPSYPVDRGLETPAELAQYLADIEQYVSTLAGQLGNDPYQLAQDLERRVAELVGFCLAIGSNKRLSKRVAKILLDEMPTRDSDLSCYHEFSHIDDPYWQNLADEARVDLWNGTGVMPLSELADGFIDHRLEVLMMMEYLFALKKNPAD